MGTRAQPPALPWQRAPPVAGASAHQSVQVAPSRERGPAGSGGGGGLSVSPGPAPSRARGSPPPRPLRLPARVTAPARPPPTAGPPLCRGSSSRIALELAPPARPGRRTARGRGVTPEHLRPARRPRKCGAAAKPRPAPPLFMGTVRRRPRGIARCPAGPRHCHAPRGGGGHSRLAAVPVSPGRDASTYSSSAQGGRGDFGGRGIAPSLTLGSQASLVLGPAAGDGLTS